jgi:hypothetical protein
MNGLMITGVMQDIHNQRRETLTRSRRGTGRRFGRKPVAGPNLVGADDGDLRHFRSPTRSSNEDEHASARVA